MYAARTANAEWFTTLFSMIHPSDIVELRTKDNETLYHLVCTLPPSKAKENGVYTDPSLKISKRRTIFKMIASTNVDVNVLTKAKKQLAFDLIADNDNIPDDDQNVLVGRWLHCYDRFDRKYSNRFLPWLALAGRFEEVRDLCSIASTDLNIRTADKNTALLFAAGNEHVSIVKELLSYYPQRLKTINYQRKDGMTALQWACQINCIEVVRILCSIPEVDLNLADQDGDTPLMSAAMGDHTEVVKELLQYYPHRLKNVNHQNKYGCTVLHVASESNAIEVVKLLCSISDVDLNLPDSIGFTPLVEAATHEGTTTTSIFDEIMQYYPHRIKNLNHQSKEGYTALIWACEENNIDVVNKLLSFPEVDINIASDHGTTPLIAASFRGHSAIVDALLSHYPHRLRFINNQDSKGNTALHMACCKSHIDIVRKLCRYPEVDMNVRNNEGKTLPDIALQQRSLSMINELLNYVDRLDLHRLSSKNETLLYWACCHNHVDIVQRLIVVDTMDPNISSKETRDTPLIYSVEKGYIPIVDILLQYAPQRVNVNQRRANGETALSVAVQNNQIDIVRKLLAVPSTDLTKDWNGKTILSIATEHNYLPLIHELLNYPDRLNINRPIDLSTNETLLYWASKKNHKDMVHRLCTTFTHLNLNVQTIQQYSALTIAASLGYFSIVQELLQYSDRLNINQVTRDGNTVLHYVCEKNSVELVRILSALPIMDLNKVNTEGCTALGIAADKQYYTIVNELLQYAPDRLDLNRPINGKSETFLYWCCKHNARDLVRQLCLMDTVDLNRSVGKDGDTPLMCAVEKDYVAIVDILLEYVPLRLDVNQGRTKDNLTSLLIAVTNGNNEIVKRLCRIPTLDTQILTIHGNSPLKIARAKRYTEIINTLMNRNEGEEE